MTESSGRIARTCSATPQPVSCPAIWRSAIGRSDLRKLERALLARRRVAHLALACDVLENIHGADHVPRRIAQGVDVDTRDPAPAIRIVYDRFGGACAFAIQNGVRHWGLIERNQRMGMTNRTRP